MTKIATSSADRLAIYIDNSNLWNGSGFDSENTMIDYRTLVDELADGREICFCKVYDSYRHKTVKGEDRINYGLRDYLSDNGFETYFKDTYDPIKDEQKQIDGMINVDITKDAFMDRYDRLILVSGDEDFVPGLTAAKELGKKVEIASFSKCLARELRNCGKFTCLDDMVIGIDKGNVYQKEGFADV